MAAYQAILYHVTFLANILYRHHGEIVTLLCIAHELMDSLGHLGYELARLMLLMGEGM